MHRVLSQAGFAAGRFTSFCGGHVEFLLPQSSAYLILYLSLFICVCLYFPASLLLCCSHKCTCMHTHHHFALILSPFSSFISRTHHTKSKHGLQYAALLVFSCLHSSYVLSLLYSLLIGTSCPLLNSLLMQVNSSKISMHSTQFSLEHIKNNK